MKRVQSIIAAVALVTALTGLARAQDAGALPVYVAVECMKSSSPDYVTLEQEAWLPVHQYLVNAGKRSSWSLYRVVYGDRSRCDYYTVTTYRGADQLNASAAYEEAFAAVHAKNSVDALMAKTLGARELVASELWLQLDQTELRPHRYAVVNKMYAEDETAYESMESRVFKAGHQVLIDKGLRSGWAVYALVSPIGSSIPYNYGTVDFVDDLGPVPMAEAMLVGNPDRDLDAMHDLLALRDHVLSETWELVAATEAAAGD